MNHLETVQKLGLSKTEAQIYLANLEMGPSSAIQLGQKLGLTRQLMYNLLPDLIEKGYVKQIQIGKKRFFQSVEPEILEDKAKALTAEIKAIVPDLKQITGKTGAVPIVTIYDNPLSMREWYRYFMSEVKVGEKKDIYSTETGWFDLDTDFYRGYAKFQAKMKLRNRVIIPDNPEARHVAGMLPAPAFEYRYSSEEWFGHVSKWIWRDQIINLTIRGKATNMIVIESEELANIERFTFNKVWNSLPAITLSTPADNLENQNIDPID